MAHRQLILEPRRFVAYCMKIAIEYRSFRKLVENLGFCHDFRLTAELQGQENEISTRGDEGKEKKSVE